MRRASSSQLVPWTRGGIVDTITLQEGIAAAQLRAKHKSLMSITDAISMALASSRSATLVTTDNGIRDTKEKGAVLHFGVNA